MPATRAESVAPAAQAKAPPTLRKGGMQHFYRPWLFAAPGLIALVAIIGIPLGAALNYSLHEVFLYRFHQQFFIGLENYERIFADPLFRRSLQTTVIFTIGNTVIAVVLGLLVAFLLSAKRIHFKTGFMALFLLPFVMTQVVVGEFETIFTLTGGGPGRTTTVLSILAYNRGIANQDMGIANAIAFTMFVIMATVAWIYITLFRAREERAS